MSGNRGCIFNSIMFLVIVFVPVVGHIILTIMVLEDDHSLAGTALWLAIIWLIPFLGPCSIYFLGSIEGVLCLANQATGTTSINTSLCSTSKNTPNLAERVVRATTLFFIIHALKQSNPAVTYPGQVYQDQ